MTFVERRYVYGVKQDGSREFLMTFLNTSQAKDYVNKHRKLFPNRFKHYVVGDHYTNNWEVI